MAYQSEHAFQQECRIWFHNQYPMYRGLLFHVRNNADGARDGAYWKELGVIKGVADFLFLFNNKCHCIELKTPRGSQSDEQIDWERKVVEQGIDYYLVNSIEQFQKLMRTIIYNYECTKSIGHI